MGCGGGWGGTHTSRTQKSKALHGQSGSFQGCLVPEVKAALNTRAQPLAAVPEGRARLVNTLSGPHRRCVCVCVRACVCEHVRVRVCACVC